LKNSTTAEKSVKYFYCIYRLEDTLSFSTPLHNRRTNPGSGFGASNETGSTRTRTLKLKLIYLGLLGGNYQKIWC